MRVCKPYHPPTASRPGRPRSCDATPRGRTGAQVVGPPTLQSTAPGLLSLPSSACRSTCSLSRSWRSPRPCSKLRNHLGQPRDPRPTRATDAPRSTRAAHRRLSTHRAHDRPSPRVRFQWERLGSSDRRARGSLSDPRPRPARPRRRHRAIHAAGGGRVRSYRDRWGRWERAPGRHLWRSRGRTAHLPRAIRIACAALCSRPESLIRRDGSLCSKR
jgi:hypothetical protein